jgi:hypothetical protein
MSNSSRQERQQRAAEELHGQAPDLPAQAIVERLAAGLNLTRELLLQRLHQDIEDFLGGDSMIAPVSLLDANRQSLAAKLEIDIYSALVAADELHAHGSPPLELDWLVPWLFRLRFGEQAEQRMRERCDYYASHTIEERRLKFVAQLQRVAPESIKTPLVLFRLFPRCIRIVAAIATGALPRAQQLRSEQCELLPALADCTACHARLLEPWEKCDTCGNPVWTFPWLKAQ